MRETNVAFRSASGYLLALVGVGIAYFVLAKGGLTLASINPNATPIWPPSGVALAAILLWGYRFSPAILIAAFAANVTTAGTVETSTAIAVGNTLEAAAGAWLIGRYADGRRVFDTPAGVLRFGLICLAAAAPLSATIGVTSLALGGFAAWSAFLPVWMTWWLGDLGGMLVVAPVIVLWAANDRSIGLRSAAAFVAAVAIGLFAFSPMIDLAVDRAPLGFLATLPLVWAALWQGQRDTATVALILAGFAVWGAASEGVLHAQPLNQSFLLLVALIISMTLPSLALSAEAGVRKMAAVQQELLQSERRFRLLVQSFTDYAIFLLDPEGRVSNWNAGAERIKGYSDAEIVGQHFGRFYTEEDRAAGVPERELALARTQGKHETEGWRVRKDGSRFWANAAIEAIRDEAGALVGFAKITRDITERRDAQKALDDAREQLSQAQKLEALGQLTGGVAHDFNNLLAAVQSGLSLIERSIDNRERVARLIHEVRQAANRGEGLTRQLLSFSRRQPVRPEVLDVGERVREVVGIFGPLLSGNIEVKTELPARLPAVKVDPSQFELALLNICLNARDAMPTGGSLAIGGRHDGDWVEIRIADTGVGIPDEVKKRVFEPFFTTKEVGKGSGLGLSQAYGFAQQAGGAIRLESAVGQGTTVTLRLPAAGSAVPEAVPEVRAAAPAVAGGTILLIEDDATLAALTAELFEQSGYDVWTVHSAAAALERLRKGAAIDAVFSDIVMPGEMNGIDLARKIKAEFPRTPVLLTTAYSDVAATADAHGIEIVPKPYDSTKVLGQIAEMIAQSRRKAAGNL